jgi:hypothetical protein
MKHVEDLHLNPEQTAELEAWGQRMAEKFENDFHPNPDAKIPPLMELSRLRYAQRQLEADIARQVAQARAEGDSWHKIGRCLGITGEAARRRWKQAA